MLESFSGVLAAAENERVLGILDGLAATGRLPHAIILEGDDSGDCLSVARAVARAYLCTCDTLLEGSCRACKRLASGAHPDVITAEGSSKAGQLTVDDIRAVRSDAYLVPVEAKGKVYILPDCDDMKQEAQNALLKVFEEPPAGVMFILTCRSQTHLLETIRSRARTFRIVCTVTDADSAPPELIELAGQLACALCEQGDGRAIMLLSGFADEKKDLAGARAQFRLTLQLLRGIIREALLVIVGASDSGSVSEGAARMAASIPRSRLFSMLEQLDTIEEALALNTSLGLLTTAAVVRLKR